MADDSNRKWRLISRLKSIVKKVTFLMNSNINRWRLAATFAGGGGGSRRRLSFGEGLGLTAIVSSSDDEDSRGFASGSSSSRELKKTKSFQVQRTMSFPEEDDIDKRAEMFIENFYKQLRYQRQVSLELRYSKNTSFGSSDSNSYSP